MSCIDDINDKTNTYFDEDNLVEYLFMGWDRILSVEEKLAIIAEHPYERQNPIGTLFENDVFSVSNPHPSVESTIIYRKEVEEEEAAPEQAP